VNTQVCSSCKLLIDEAKNNSTPIKIETFNQIESGVKINLCDTFSRLRLTGQFKEYYQKNKFLEETLHK